MNHRFVHAIGTGFLLCLIGAALAHADTWVVSNTNDAGAGSLRQAILDANSKAGPGGCPVQAIQFAIAGAGVHTIRPLSALPPFKIPIHLDGYSQPGAQLNTLADGSNAVLLIELDGSVAGASAGIVLAPRLVDSDSCSGNFSEISGLVINRFAHAGIQIVADACGSRPFCSLGGVDVWGNFIGTDPGGNIALGNSDGVQLGGLTEHVIIGADVPDSGGFDMPAAQVRNLISGNLGAGIYLFSDVPTGPSLNHRIRGNAIGVNAAGTAALANAGDGIYVDTGTSALRVRHNTIAGNDGNGVNVPDAPRAMLAISANSIGVGSGGRALGNGGHGVRVAGDSSAVSVGGYFPRHGIDMASIANNGGAGVFVDGNAIVNVASGSIAGNAGLAIDLAPEGVNPLADPTPGSGPNERLNYPVITRAAFDPASQGTLVEGTLHATPFSNIEIEFHLNDQCDPSGFGGAQRALSAAQIPSVSVTTDALGNGEFSRLASVALPSGRFLTALARSRSQLPGVSDLEVSELSACRRIEGPDPIFANGFETP